MCEVFISFRGNNTIGGAIATMVFNTLKNYKVETFFSSSSDRIYGGNYRNDEEIALNEAKIFIAVLTESYVDGLCNGDEVLYELSHALRNKKIKIIPIADHSFVWTNLRKKKILEFIDDVEVVDNFVKLDYIKYFGAREYTKLTEVLLLEALGINSKSNMVGDVFSLCELLLLKQEEELRVSEHSSFLRQELSSFANKFYVKPNIFVDDDKKDIDLTEFILEKSLEKSGYSIMVIGDSGCGKTTFLHKTFLNCRDILPNGYIPIFFNVNNDEIVSFDRCYIVNKVIDCLDISCGQITTENFLSAFNFVFFIDGLDEAKNFDDVTEVSRIINNKSSQDIYVFSCRKNKYRYLYNLKINLHIELRSWDEKERTEFCRNVLMTKKINPVCIDNAVNFVAESRILSNAVFLSLFLLYIDSMSGNMSMFIGLNEHKIISVLIKNIIGRECQKRDITISLPTASDILEYVACFHLKSRQDGFEVSYDELINVTKRFFSHVDVEVVHYLITLFIDENILTENYRFAHETFEEYFIAKNFTDELFKGEKTQPELLKYGFNAEINNFVSTIFKEKGCIRACDMLQKIYIGLSSGNYEIKLQLLNHLHRTEQYDYIKGFIKDMLKNAYDEIDEILLLHSLHVVGNENDENVYYEKMNSDPKFALLNSGFALAYYYNYGKNLQLPYYDDGSLSWYPVFLGYKKHILNKHKIPHYYKIIRINLLTANNFISQRKSVEPEVEEFFKSQKERFASDASQFGLKIYEEYKKLMKTIERFSVNYQGDG